MKKNTMLRKLIEALAFLKDGNGMHLQEDVFLCGEELDGSDKLYGFKSVDNDLFVETRSSSDGYPITDMDKGDLEYIFSGSKIYEKILNKEYVQSPLDANNQIDDEPDEVIENTKVYSICWEFVDSEIHLFDNPYEGKDVAVIELDDDTDRIGDLCTDIQEFIEGYDNEVTVEIKNDDDRLGIIVDIWQDDECIDTATFWFEDYQYVEEED